MTLRTFAVLASLALLGCMALSGPALADDAESDSNTVGYYIGAGLGISHLHQSFFDQGALTERSFDNDRTGWKVLVGLRPIEWLGAEIEYVDFGSAHIGPSPLSPAGAANSGEFYGAHASATAGAGFAVAYLPLPPWVDLFGKLGVSRLETRYSYSGNYPNTFINCATTCVPLGPFGTAQDNADTSFAVGIGAQVHFGQFAARLEGERFGGPDSPYLISIGITWAP